MANAKELEPTKEPQEKIWITKSPPRENLGFTNGSEEKIGARKW